MSGCAKYGRHVVGLVSIALLFACGGPAKPAESAESSQSAPPLDDQPAQTQGNTSSAGSHSPSPDVAQAMKAIEAQQFADAKETLLKALKRNGKDVLANYYMGVTLAGLGDAKGAVEYYRTSIALDAKFAEAYVNLSALQLDSKDNQGALATADAGLKNAKNPDLYLNRAIALEALGKTEEATVAYGAAVEQMPENTSLRLTYAQMLASAGKKDLAIAQLKKVADASDPKLLALAAIQVRQLGAPSECVAILDRAISQKDLAALRVRRGMCREDLKDAPGAKSDFERAVTMEPKFAPAHYYLGALLQQSGDTKKACTELKLAVELGGTEGIGPEAKKAVAASGCGK